MQAPRAPRASRLATRAPRPAPSLTTASASALPIPGGVACNQDFIVTSLSFSYIFLVYRWRDGRADLQHVLLEPLSLRERTEEGEDLDGPEEPWSRPDFAMNRLFLITTSRIGAAICVWSLTEGALLALTRSRVFLSALAESMQRSALCPKALQRSVASRGNRARGHLGPQGLLFCAMFWQF